MAAYPSRPACMRTAPPPHLPHPAWGPQPVATMHGQAWRLQARSTPQQGCAGLVPAMLTTPEHACVPWPRSPIKNKPQAAGELGQGSEHRGIHEAGVVSTRRSGEGTQGTELLQARRCWQSTGSLRLTIACQMAPLLHVRRGQHHLQTFEAQCQGVPWSPVCPHHCPCQPTNPAGVPEAASLCT